MLDMVLDAVALLSPLAIAIMSVAVGIKLARDPQGQSHKYWWRGIIALGIVCSGVTLWQQDRSRRAHTDEVRTLNNSITTLQTNFNAAEIQHTAETKYLEGKVDVFSQFAPAVVKLAEATELTSRKTYEAKMLSNKELYDATMDVVKKMRDFGLKIKMYNVQHPLTRTLAPGETDAERQRAYEEQSRQFYNNYYQREAEFRSTILQDAVYVRNELLRRKVPESSKPTPPLIEMVFMGQLEPAGGTEILAADYLEQMAKHLRLK
jgi:hypothetical protein